MHPYTSGGERLNNNLRSSTEYDDQGAVALNVSDRGAVDAVP